MLIKPVKNGFIFKFLEKIERGQFVREKTKTGIIFQADFDSSAKLPRWVEVLFVGPQCKDVKVGQQVLLPALRWTERVKYNDILFWKSDESQVVAVRESENSVVVPLNTWVIFERLPSEVRLPSGLFIVHRAQVTNPSGKIVSTGPDCETYLQKGTKFYFNGINFYNNFFIGEKEYSFINQEDILAFEYIDESTTAE